VFLAERYLRRRYWEGFAEGFAEAREEGRAEGLAEVRAECDAEWVAWLSRLHEAEARGEPFGRAHPCRAGGAQPPAGLQIMFLAERYLRRRYWEGFAEGFAEDAGRGASGRTGRGAGRM
jgi:hypothetical protein